MIYIVLILLWIADIYNTPVLIPNIKLALFFAYEYFENFKSLEINTPRSLSSSIDLTQPSIWYWNSKSLFLICIIPHLFILKSISYLFGQATNLSRFLCIDFKSLRLFPLLFLWSANLEISQSTSLSMSSIKIIKKSGPKTVLVIHHL